MTSIALPALDGRTPLGFLAALGTMRLIVDHTENDAKLSWSPRDCTAVLHSSHTDLDTVVADLVSVMRSIPAGGALPGVSAEFPPLGAAPDKLRLPRPDFRTYAERITDNPQVERWLGMLVTDLTLDNEKRIAITPYAAPSGKQSMRTMLEKPLAELRKRPELLREALTGWRRQPGVTGEYLDHRVLYDTADTPDGRDGSERGVPGATWLALMAYPLLSTTAPTGPPLSTCWQDRGRNDRRMVYPLWSQQLDIPAIVALLNHPVLGTAEDHRPSPQAKLLSIFWIGHAGRRRIPARKSAGVLAPIAIQKGRA
ncbi:type I-G CRISPR-associated protein, Cas3-extension family [Actinoplanes awajinensis]|uniref:Type I-U CRISPR-associated protein Csx17 n=1 Tax=Actinoplanes awajinensis subsp. mycoplanecinus TaxID=135947 RepID=A0A117MQ12_9ACTN|nr:hypothetical protein [Actinoplanes awajinensis]KUL29469.1 hypothetical protein ADL15_28050 [Actinoplanes awajinensis subsp. mycoplanecinus]